MAKNTNFDNDTIYAIKAIFLGARIHDAAALCDRSDASMRRLFLMFCEKTNKTKFEEICVNAVNDGWSNPPVNYFQEHIEHFLSEKEATLDFMGEYLEDVDNVLGYYKRCISNATKTLRIARARHAAMTQAIHLIGDISA